MQMGGDSSVESTGVYWHPVWNILEEGRQILLANPQHLKAVPGRKTDGKDSEWLADLHWHGLLITPTKMGPPNRMRDRSSFGIGSSSFCMGSS